MFSRRNGLLVITVGVLAGTGLAVQAKPAARRPVVAKAKTKPALPRPDLKPDLKLMQVQVILDHLDFSPGVIDGKAGSGLKLALTGFQTAKGLPVTGNLDPATTQMLQQYHAVRALRTVTLAPTDLAGPYVGALPRREEDKAALPSLGYANPLEMLAERYHTTPATLKALNPHIVGLVAGSVLRVPDTTTWTRDYPANLPVGYRQTLAGLNVGSSQPRAAKLLVSNATRSMSVYDAAGKLIAQFPVTTGSRHDPLPIGEWKIVGAAYNPEYHFNPKLFWDAKTGDKAATLRPGPKGPVGIVWLGINKPHYGIHGTPQPQNIGRTESHGCIRLTNWDAGRLSLMVMPGTPAVFQP
jgi:lipoprotein-anchoring transpeptidase ErfK/SrfK